MADVAIGALAVRISADLGDLIDGFNRADKAVEKFSRQLDKRVTDPLMKITAAAAAAGAAVFAFAKSAADTVDELGKLSQKVGINVEALSGLKFAAQLSDVSLDQLGQGLKQLSKFMVENKIEGVGVEEQLLRIADEFANAADSEQKTAAAMKLFGKAGADLIPLLNQGRAGIEELRKEAERLGVVFSTEAAKKAEEFNDNLTRLKNAAEGLQIQMAGPLVEALNKAAQAMLNAKNQGEGLFSTLIEGFRTLVTGDDLHKWNVQMFEATERLGAAQNNVSRLSNIGGWAAARGLKKAREEIAAAEADIKRLLAIKPILAPEAAAAKVDPKTGQIKSRLSPEEIERRIKLFEKLRQLGDTPPQDTATVELQKMLEAAEERVAREQQVRDVLHEVRKAEDARELEQIALQNKAKEEAEIKAIEQRLLLREHELEEQTRMSQEEFQARRQAAEDEKALQRERLSATAQGLGNLASLMNTSSRRTFEIGKVAAIAEAGLRTTAAVIDAWGWGMKLFGPAGAAAAATAAGIAGLNYINNLRSQSFGGGGGAPTPAGQGSSGVAAASGAPAGGPEGGGGQTTLIKIEGDIFSADMVRKLLEKINTGTRKGGGRIVLV